MNSWESLLFDGVTRAGVGADTIIKPAVECLMAGLPQQRGVIVAGIEQSRDKKREGESSLSFKRAS